MCIFITVITKASDKDLISNILTNAGRRAELVDNPSIRAAIGPNEIQLLTTSGHCDCDSVLCDSRVDDFVNNFEDEVRKLRRKKWSQGKIDRYIEDRRKAEEKKVSSRASDSFELWEGVIDEVQKSGASCIGLFYKMYSGSVTKEYIEPIVKKTKLSEEALRLLSENEILYFI